ncbi:MAG: hypothetical protein H6Q59_964 [Firmicutes bacterium]|nr:hypothetical protein [Bacillota bacterium]
MATRSTAVKLTLKVTSFIVRLLMNIFFYILVVILIINVSKFAYTFTYQLYGPDTVDEAPGRDIIFQITKGESKMDIATKLELNHAIKSKYSFFLKTKLQEYVIMPGTYIINSSMTYNEILGVITDYSKSIVKDEEGKVDEGASKDGSTTDTGAATEQKN